LALPQWELILRLLAAAVFGSVIGFERERAVRAAGLRTHMLVCVGSCLVMVVSAYGFSSVLSEHVVLDPSRVAAQVVSGIGFLGAGSIILRKESVRGLTTAASIWATAAIGLAAGGGLYTAAVASTAIILLILAGLKPIETRYDASRRSFELHLRARRGEASIPAIEKALARRPARVKQLVIERDEQAEADDLTLILTRVAPQEKAEIRRIVEQLPFIIPMEEGEPQG
jgi:putative Mg2+ transporter-C (MgtC) family protein